MKREVCAGIFFVTPKGKGLFLKRSDHGPYSGYWGLPGGHLAKKETHKEAAIRETHEEIKYKVKHPDKLIEINRQLSILEGDESHATKEIDYTTFLYVVDKEFDVELNKEHEGHVWSLIEDHPTPIHPGLDITIKKLFADELQIAKMMAAGDLPSPQHYMNLALFDIRITGTGLSYRSGLDEFVWRDQSIYLNQEFLERCNGLPVIFEHPGRATLNTKEYLDRNVGSVFLPYIKGDDVWAIVKIWDEHAARIMENNQLSTSPCVVLYGGDTEIPFNGKTLLIEGKPRLLDHIAICPQGVWDKAGPPTGVSSITVGDLVMADSDDKAAALEVSRRVDAEEQSRKDAKRAARAAADAAAGEQLDKTLACLDAITKRMDAFEELEKKKEEERADKKAKKDAERADKQARKDAKKKAKADAEAQKKADEEAKAKADAEAEVRQRIADVEKRLPKQMTDADYAAMADAQVRADKIFLMHGNRAPRPLDGETLIAYRRRLAANLKEHSPTWKDVDLNVIADDVAFGNVEKTIYSDATNAGMNPVAVSDDFLREIINEDVTGRKISTFVGKPSAWMNQFASPKRKLVGIRNTY